jgi:hypothetical protein
MAFNIIESRFGLTQPIIKHRYWAGLTIIDNQTEIFKLFYLLYFLRINIKRFLHINYHRLGFRDINLELLIGTKSFKSY